MSKIFDEYAEARLKNSGRPTAAERIDAWLARGKIAAQSGQRAGVAKDAEQIADLVLGHAEGLRVSSPLETRNGFGSDVEHCFEVSDGSNRFGVVIILTRLKAAAASHTQQQEGQ